MSSIMPFLTRSEPTWTNDDQGVANQMTLGPLEHLRISSYINSLTVLLADLPQSTELIPCLNER